MTFHLHNVWASMEASEDDVDTSVDATEAELEAAEASTEAAEADLNQNIEAVDTAERVGTGLEGLLDTLTALAKREGGLNAGHIVLANHAYGGLMGSVTPMHTTIVSSMEEFGVVVDADAAEDKAEKEHTAEVDFEKPVMADISTEAFEGVKKNLQKAGAAAKELGSTLWKKIVALIDRVVAFFAFAKKRTAALKSSVNSLKDADRKEGEFTVPKAEALRYGNKVSVEGIVKGAATLATFTGKYADLVVSAANTSGVVGSKLDTERANVSGAIDTVRSNIKKTLAGDATRFMLGDYKPNPDTGRPEGPTAKLPETEGKLKQVPSKSELQQLLGAADELASGSQRAKGYRKEVVDAFREYSDGDAKAKVKSVIKGLFGREAVPTWFTRCGTGARNIQKLVEAALKSYGATAPAAPAEPEV